MFEPEAETSFSPDGDRNHSGAAAAGCDAAHRQSPSNVFDEVVAETRGELETEEFSGFGSDSDSLSMSDGYSVHELVADSDGFLSERDFDGHEHAAEDPTIHEEDLLEDKAVHISSANNPSISLSCSETQWKDAGDEDDDDESDQLWEHQDLIEQLRLELREERDIGLPTIVEESESPKTVDDLKPLTTIDKSLLLHEAAVDELHKSHKSYRERMRKLDVFNYQKMYAIGKCFFLILFLEGLSVSFVAEDLEETMEDQQKVNCVVTSELIEEIMKESLRIFWEFVKTDKDATPCILRGFIGSHAELQDPPDFDLMEVVRSDLHKVDHVDTTNACNTNSNILCFLGQKEKKLREMLGTGNCIIKKFKKPKEDRSNQDLFFSQVDLKLVGRVLRMSKVKTEQLVWCHRKLSNIKFVERRIHREPSFSLFPC
ncbi:hypothetical protein BHM03_00012231 [Ensete ventricosum]|nr:hypothetical protein BHM03_00012231 [Ensete ventricosum]